jgi:hypothetical protein
MPAALIEASWRVNGTISVCAIFFAFLIFGGSIMSC